MNRTALALVLLPVTLAAQAILQQGIAVTSGTLAGSLLGKQLSDTLEQVKKVSDEAAEALEETQRTDAKRREEWKRLTPAKRPVSPAVRGAGSTMASVPAGSAATPGQAAPEPRPRRSRPAAASAQPEWASGIDSWLTGAAAQPRSSYAQPITAAPVNPEALRGIEIGQERAQVIEKLGTPAARVTIPEEGRLLEVYYYHDKGEAVGAVRLGNGAVTDVVVNN
jgi:hypothetical protein